MYMLKRQLASSDDIFHDAIKRYSRISSLALAAALYTKCPRELRDMVYYYLLDGPGAMVARAAAQVQRH
ncbi:hypothetical protein P171DRAFT_429490 [Karstenula rhodostoma CBS 690.94]|uniref:Uncharacterized protein n=1 Tax=Karstenula rhodostoma CBS 690.94 TaxID=1392251 RepID=A0A9P4PML1_9PLEO|nr:hypothetical protein P171DRAFT_429490 [Karstenula rhodostoma CBS 690.94]